MLVNNVSLAYSHVHSLEAEQCMYVAASNHMDSHAIRTCNMNHPSYILSCSFLIIPQLAKDIHFSKRFSKVNKFSVEEVDTSSL